MSQNPTLSALRLKYKDSKDVFLEENLKCKEPIGLFREWLDCALAAEDVMEPNAACLATVSKEGLPSNRFVLLKDITNDGFTFFTNYASHKANDIAANPNVAMTLYWIPLHRQIRIEGIAEKISHEESLAYFRQRPRASQIGALASPQSKRIPSRKHLDEIEKNLIQIHGTGGEIPMPNWGGYLIRPRLVEFWEGQSNRLHDRIQFRRATDIPENEVDSVSVHRGESGWIYERLAP